MTEEKIIPKIMSSEVVDLIRALASVDLKNPPYQVRPEIKDIIRRLVQDDIALHSHSNSNSKS
jgi:hypothetical protein